MTNQRLLSFAVALVVAALCARFAAAEEPATTPAAATQPVFAVTDEAFDAALTKARDMQGAELQQTLAPVASRFESVDVCTTAGRNMWSIRTLNRRGKQMDGLRFTVPDGTHTHLYWAFAIANLDSWYIIPEQGQLHGFDDFYPNQKFNLPPVLNRRLILQSLSRRLTPGDEYILWFKFKQPGAVQAYVSLVLLDDDVANATIKDIQAAIGFTKK